jgi:MOSC domain-containing protein YiiM
MFGENFTTEGLTESELHIGDSFQVGTATVMVRQPRMPCYKLVAKFQRDDMIQRFLESGHSGFYFSVEREGIVAVGDTFELLSRNPSAVTIEEMNRLFVAEKYNRSLLKKALATSALPQDWHDYLSRRLAGTSVNAG